MMTIANTSLDGKVAIVTGGSRGIGRAIALALADSGADVAVSARGAEALNGVRDEIAARGRRALAVPADAGKSEDLERLTGATIAELGGVDVLVNNAGVAIGQASAEVDQAHFDKVMHVNVWGPLRLSQLCRESMVTRGGGVIINIASNSGMIGEPGFGMYPASKAALINMTQQLAKEWGGDNIRVVGIAPGVIRTEMAQPLLDILEENPNLPLNPLNNRIGEPEDIGAMAALLASDAGRFCTATTLVVDGGELTMSALGA
jgi:NAD(P)-dependent dehydrogenase (short-subunit alcohol dehydrogenase family)